MRVLVLNCGSSSLKFRVTDPEPGIPESVQGVVITALNEESIASAALANKGGINLTHAYEAFGGKMHGASRQEITFSTHCQEDGRLQRWLSVPLLLTSHTWENGKNEQSHQDPSMAETMLGLLGPLHTGAAAYYVYVLNPALRSVRSTASGALME